MDQVIFLKYIRNNIKLSIERLQIGNYEGLQRILQACEIIYELDPESRTLIDSYIKKIYSECESIKNDASYYTILNSFVLILEWAKHNNNKELMELIQQKLNSIKGYYVKEINHSSNKCSLEDLLFYPYDQQKYLRNTISLKDFYIALKYKQLIGNLDENQVKIAEELILFHYYLDSVDTIAFFPASKGYLRSIKPSRAADGEKDFWFYSIMKIFSAYHTIPEKYVFILSKIIERSKYILDSYESELEINNQSFYAISILLNEKSDLTHRIEKIIINFRRLVSDAYKIYQLLKQLNLDWNIIELENEGLNKTSGYIIKILDYMEDKELFPIKIIKFFRDLLEEFMKNKELDFGQIAEKYMTIVQELPLIDKTLEYSFFSSYYGEITVPIELMQEKDQIDRNMLAYIFGKFLFDEFFPIKSVFIGLYNIWSKYPLSYDNMAYFIDEDEIQGCLLNFYQFQRPSREQELTFFPAYSSNSFSRIKERMEEIEQPYLDVDEYQFEYLVYPNAVLKMDLLNNKIDGIRLTIAFRDYVIQEKLSLVQNLFSNYFNELCRYAEKEYEIYQYMGKTNGPENMVLNIKDLFNDGYRYVLKTDIYRCTDFIIHSQLKQILTKTLPDSIAAIINYLATQYSVEFEDRRVIPFRGIGQGNPLSTELYVYIIMVCVILSYDQTKITSDEVITLGSGDDIVIMSKSQDRLANFYRAMEQNINKIGWNFQKEKCLIVSPQPITRDYLSEIQIKEGFNLVGYHLDFTPKFKIALINDRIYRLKFHFWHSFLDNLQRMYQSKEIHFENYLQSIIQFDLVTKKYPTIEEFNLWNFLNNRFSSLSGILSLTLNEFDLNQQNIKENYQKLYEDIHTHSLFPPEKAFKPYFIVYTDGAADPNPGKAGAGVRIESVDKTISVDLCEYLGIKSSTEAEYYAVYIALDYILKNFGSTKKVLVKSDLKSMVNNLMGYYYNHNTRIRDLYGYIQQKISHWGKNHNRIRFEHFYGRENGIAHDLSQLAIKEFQAGKKRRYIIHKANDVTEN